jgi:hypothetical protein
MNSIYNKHFFVIHQNYYSQHVVQQLQIDVDDYGDDFDRFSPL